MVDASVSYRGLSDIFTTPKIFLDGNVQTHEGMFTANVDNIPRGKSVRKFICDEINRITKLQLTEADIALQKARVRRMGNNKEVDFQDFKLVGDTNRYFELYYKVKHWNKSLNN